MKQKHSFTLRVAVSAALVMTSAASTAQVKPAETAVRQEFLKKLVEAAVERAQHAVRLRPPRMCGFHIQAATFRPTQAFARMK